MAGHTRLLRRQWAPWATLLCACCQTGALASSAAKGSEEAGAEGAVTKTTVTVSLLLFGFLVFDMVLLHLVNYNDANVRSYIYKMISSTISIFCAVNFNEALTCSIDQLLYAPRPWGLGFEDLGGPCRFAVEMVIFALTFVLLNVLCYHFRFDNTRLHAVQVIGGHIVAFSGIATFGRLQLLQPTSLLWVVGAAAFAGVLCIVFRLASMCLRMKAAGEQTVISAIGLLDGEARHSTVKTDLVLEHGHSVPHDWRHSICSAEDEATAIITSFLAQQVVGLLIAGRLSPLELETGKSVQHTFTEVQKLFYCALIFSLLLCITTYCRASLDRGQLVDPTSMNVRLTNGTQNFLAMTMSWSLFFMSDAQMSLVLQKHEHLTEVATAFVVSGLAVLGVIILDFFADNVHANDKADDKRTGHFGTVYRVHSRMDNPDMMMMRAMASQESLLSTTGDLSAHVQVMITEHSADLQNFGDEEDDLDDDYLRASLPTLDTSHLEKALRAVIGAFGLLVGLAWEKAFHASGEAIIEGVPAVRGHIVVGKFCMAAVLVMLVLPGWQAFIVPMAQKHWQEHEALMELESCQSGAPDGSESAAAIRLLASGDQLSDRELVTILQRLVANRSHHVKARLAKAMDVAAKIEEGLHYDRRKSMRQLQLTPKSPTSPVAGATLLERRELQVKANPSEVSLRSACSRQSPV
eukprot:TRINITY_DN9314_c0_g1_i1.p1 TRINITY_DN9314_c0_g1~~TRINITY_DN9314_c0_g1_i1.p1  ORF type:complete len:692 (+),score=145.52 TRINITY_DN9314_c0_g1_i1:116-2191(+)